MNETTNQPDVVVLEDIDAPSIIWAIVLWYFTEGGDVMWDGPLGGN